MHPLSIICLEFKVLSCKSRFNRVQILHKREQHRQVTLPTCSTCRKGKKWQQACGRIVVFGQRRFLWSRSVSHDKSWFNFLNTKKKKKRYFLQCFLSYLEESLSLMNSSSHLFLHLMRFSVKAKRSCKGAGCNCFLHILPQPRTLDVNNIAAYGFSHLTAGAILTCVMWRGGMFSFGLGVQHFRGKITI